MLSFVKISQTIEKYVITIMCNFHQDIWKIERFIKEYIIYFIESRKYVDPNDISAIKVRF